jgi:hypothetical protein
LWLVHYSNIFSWKGFARFALYIILLKHLQLLLQPFSYCQLYSWFEELMAAVALVGSKRFSVVEFVDENMVEAIPTCWVDDLNSAAWWPRGLNSGQLSKAITNCTQPDDSAGDRFLIRVLGQAGM